MQHDTTGQTVNADCDTTTTNKAIRYDTLVLDQTGPGSGTYGFITNQPTASTAVCKHDGGGMGVVRVCLTGRTPEGSKKLAHSHTHK